MLYNKLNKNVFIDNMNIIIDHITIFINKSYSNIENNLTLIEKSKFEKVQNKIAELKKINRDNEILLNCLKKTNFELNDFVISFINENDLELNKNKENLINNNKEIEMQKEISDNIIKKIKLIEKEVSESNFSFLEDIINDNIKEQDSILSLKKEYFDKLKKYKEQKNKYFKYYQYLDSKNFGTEEYKWRIFLSYFDNILNNILSYTKNKEDIKQLEDIINELSKKQDLLIDKNSDLRKQKEELIENKKVEMGFYDLHRKKNKIILEIKKIENKKLMTIASIDDITKNQSDTIIKLLTLGQIDSFFYNECSKYKEKIDSILKSNQILNQKINIAKNEKQNIKKLIIKCEEGQSLEVVSNLFKEILDKIDFIEFKESNEYKGLINNFSNYKNYYKYAFKIKNNNIGIVDILLLCNLQNSLNNNNAYKNQYNNYLFEQHEIERLEEERINSYRNNDDDDDGFGGGFGSGGFTTGGGFGGSGFRTGGEF